VGAHIVHGEATLIRWLHGCYGRIFCQVLSAQRGILTARGGVLPPQRRYTTKPRFSPVIMRRGRCDIPIYIWKLPRYYLTVTP